MATAVALISSGHTESLNRKLVTRWGGFEDLFTKGWVGIPVQFLTSYANLKPYGLSSGEVLFVMHLMAFKWDHEAPFPSYRRLAQRMGISDKMVRRYAAQMESKGYLKRISRIGRSNTFDLTPLFEAVRSSINPHDQEAEEDEE